MARTARLKYHQRFTLSHTSGAAASHEFLLNSCYDPDSSTGGGQPVGFDQLTAIYQKFIVYACDVKLRFTSVGTTAPTQFTQVAIAPANSTGSWGGAYLDDICAAPFAQWTIFGPGSQGSENLYYNYSIPLLTGETKEALFSDPQYEHSASANPSRTVYVTVKGQPVDQSSTATTICYIELEYYVYCHDRKELVDA
jgi:hypothetical protein